MVHFFLNNCSRHSWFDSEWLFFPVFLPDGWLHSLELGFYVGFNVGHIERAINGDLEGLSAIKLMANMCWMEVLAGIKKEHDI